MFCSQFIENKHQRLCLLNLCHFIKKKKSEKKGCKALWFFSRLGDWKKYFFHLFIGGD